MTRLLLIAMITIASFLVGYFVSQTVWSPRTHPFANIAVGGVIGGLVAGLALRNRT